MREKQGEACVVIIHTGIVDIVIASSSWVNSLIEHGHDSIFDASLDQRLKGEGSSCNLCTYMYGNVGHE